jgi:hemerythrin-like metal-binding protein
MEADMNPSPGSLPIQSGPLGQSTINLRRLIAWGEHYKVDQPRLDAQHEEIFDIALEVSDIWQRRGDLQRLKDVTDKLAGVLAAHFEYEEQQFAGTAYAHCAEHCEEHRMMLAELQTIRGRLEAMGPGRVRSEPGFLVLSYVLGLTVGHLSHSDMDAHPARHAPA